MMRKPVQSLHVSSTPPMPHRRAFPSAANSGCEKNVTHSGKGAHVEVTTDEVDAILHHVSMKTLQERGRGVTLLGNFVVVSVD